VRIGVGRSDPHGEAVRDAGKGSAGDEGLGAAAWRRRIAPRHRDAVRGFFDPNPGHPETKPVPAGGAGK
jgi:hypothetical protein